MLFVQGKITEVGRDSLGFEFVSYGCESELIHEVQSFGVHILFISLDVWTTIKEVLI